jgi:CBS domain containing-hemolysin-like protein
MTPVPKCIEASEPVATARHIMRNLGVRHLPVCRDGQLVGVLHEHGLDRHRGDEGQTPSVERVMVTNPYLVAPETPLRRVAAEMAAYRTDSAVVIDENGAVAGIFTTTDALDALVELIPPPYVLAG